MSPEQKTNLTVDQALKILKQYSCIEVKNVNSPAEKEQLCQALLLITSLSESENLGICADNSATALTALTSYLKALGYQPKLTEIPEINTPIYLKFSTQKMSHYLDSYSGEYRGVLVSCFSEENPEISGTYGHLPLDLFQ